MNRRNFLRSSSAATLGGLTVRMRASTTVDWKYRESVRAAMRLMIKRLLKKYKYPPDGQDDAVMLVKAGGGAGGGVGGLASQ
ncbi:MAG: DUF3387 domain-containing protein [Flavobacteriales bacterium]|nr:DUF3387 domain-containing protein [Flavobacteriales bacterium]